MYGPIERPFLLIIIILVFLVSLVCLPLVLTKQFHKKVLVPILVFSLLFNGSILAITFLLPVPPMPEHPGFAELERRKNEILQKLEPLSPDEKSAMEAEVSGLVLYVHQILAGEIPASETKGTLLDQFNYLSSEEDWPRGAVRSEYEFKVNAVYLEGSKGEMWVEIKHYSYDASDNPAGGTGPAEYIWTIEKIDEKWTVVDLYAAT